MPKRAVWAVSSGDYSSYHVVALFEDEADARAVADRMNDGHGDPRVEGFRLYSPGDRSLRRGVTWQAIVNVDPDGRITDAETYRWDDDQVDADGPVSGPVEVRKRWDEAAGFRVTGRGLTEEQAVKGVRDRAAVVASQMLEGMDPRDIAHGPPTDEQIALDHGLALVAEDRRREQLRRAGVQRELGRRVLAEKARILQWQRTTLVALHLGDERISSWIPYASGVLPLPQAHWGDAFAVRLRTEDGTQVTPELISAKVLGAEGRMICWSTDISVDVEALRRGMGD